MEEKKNEWFKGDKVLWSVIIIFCLLSIGMVFSTSNNLEYVRNEGTVWGHTAKHTAFLILGLGVIKAMDFIKYEFIGRVNLYLVLPIMIGALVYATLLGQKIGGASAARWIPIPVIGGFQPSVFAYFSVIIYICRFLAKNSRMPENQFLRFLMYAPIYIVFGLVGKENGSTGLIIFGVSVLVMILGQMYWKHILEFIAGILIAGVAFIALAKMGIIPENRVDTWESRIIVHFISEEEARARGINIEDKNYQTDRAKAAIYHGGWKGVGPGKSALKHSLSQSESDFVFAIIVEEYGFIGAMALMGLYLIMIIRIVIIATKTPQLFASLLVLAIALMIAVQLVVHIAVSLKMFPVTGQPLPLISYGGSSMLITFVQLGIVMNISSRIQLRDEEGIGNKQSIEEINDIA